MKNNIFEPKYLIIKNLSQNLNINKLEFLKEYNSSEYHYISSKMLIYLYFENNQDLNFIYENKFEEIKNNLGKKIIIEKNDKLPLDLNPGNNILLIFFSKNKNNYKIDINFIKRLIKLIDKPEKLIFFYKNKTKQMLLKFENNEIAKNVKKNFPLILKRFDISLKIYYTLKKDLEINEKNNNEINFGKEEYNVIKDKFTNLKDRKLINNNKLNCNIVIVYKDNNINLNQIYNFFSIFGYIKYIILNKDYYKLIYYNNHILKYIRKISNELMNLKLYFPSIENNEINNKLFLENENDIYYKNNIKKLDNFHLNFNQVSNFLIIKNLDNNYDLKKLITLFRNKIELKNSIILIEKINFNNIVLISNKLEICYRIITIFNNFKLNHNIIKIKFAKKKIIEFYIRKYKVEKLFEEYLI